VTARRPTGIVTGPATLGRPWHGWGASRPVACRPFYRHGFAVPVTLRGLAPAARPLCGALARALLFDVPGAPVGAEHEIALLVRHVVERHRGEPLEERDAAR
jgi:hypothetical protein